MIRQRVSLAVAGTVIAATALTAGLATPANAVDTLYDPGFVPSATDLVGVGSDTSEIAMDYLSKGHNGVDGWNALNPSTRIASWAAAGTPTSISLREGHTAIVRSTVNGSTNGKNKLHGAGNDTDVNFARSSSALSAGEVTDGLQAAPFAVDGLKLAVRAAGTNAPLTITPAQMVGIYKGEIVNWSEIGGAPGVIEPLTPQPGSGTRSFWDAQLKLYNGNVTVVYGAAVTETQEHSFAEIQSDPNAIAPFSTGRAKAAPSITTIDGDGSFSAKRALYNVFRTADLSGPNASVIDSAFGEEGFICSSAAKPLIEAAGFDQLATTDRGGVCGELTQSATSNFKNSTEAADETTTVLAAEALNGNQMKLTATVTGLPEGENPDGEVEFKEDGDVVATETVELNSEDENVAVATLDEVTSGEHTYTATFIPADDGLFKTSTSGSASSTVLTDSLVTVGIFNPTATFGTTRLVAISATIDREPATGSVQVKVDNGAPVTVPLVGDSGAAFYTVPGTTAFGAHTVTVTLAGTSGVFGDTATAPLTVTKATTKSTFKFSDATISASTTPKATATVTINGASVKPAGTVVFKEGSTTLGSGTLGSTGTKLVSLKKLKKGTHKVRVFFTPSSGNTANYGSSISGYVTIKVS